MPECESGGSMTCVWRQEDDTQESGVRSTLSRLQALLSCVDDELPLVIFCLDQVECSEGNVPLSGCRHTVVSRQRWQMEYVLCLNALIFSILALPITGLRIE